MKEDDAIGVSSAKEHKKNIFLFAEIKFLNLSSTKDGASIILRDYHTHNVFRGENQSLKT